jgi:hypothetical protein
VLSGGLSDARVFRLKVHDQLGATRISAVAKIGSRSAIRTEARNYDDEVARLSPDATPRRLETAEFGGKSTAGVFYSLAEGYDQSLFQLTATDPPKLDGVIDSLAKRLLPWSDGVPETRVAIADVRRRMLDDAAFARVVTQFKLDWVREFEKRNVQVRLCTVHGDLHGGNVLLNAVGVPVLIDYGDVGAGIAALDPVTLEFSHFFHPDGPFRASAWPTSAAARQWWNFDVYLADSPVPHLSQACSRWTKDVCAGNREIAAAAYAYCIRQLKYAETNKDRAIDFMLGARALFNAT